MRFLALLSDWLRQRREASRMTSERALARRGEDLAHRFLQRRGYRVIARNYRTPSGGSEVDLIAWQAERLVFVEVKTRMSDRDSAPERAVTPEKQTRLIRVASDYVGRAKADWSQVRFDVIAIREGRPPQIDLYPGRIRGL